MEKLKKTLLRQGSIIRAPIGNEAISLSKRRIKTDLENMKIININIAIATDNDCHASSFSFYI